MTRAARAIAEKEDLRTSVVAGRDASPVLEPAEIDLDPVSPLVSAIVIFDGRFPLSATGVQARFPLRIESGLY